MPKPDVPEIHLETRDQLREWLSAHHDGDASAIWLVQWRTPTGRPQISYDDIVEECLCFGWIDSTVRTFDEERRGLYLSRRKKGSTWSASNKQRLERLIPSGLMQPAGLAVIDRAKADGSWSLLDSVEALQLPDDLAAALDAQPPARQAYEGFTRGVKKQLLWWVVSAKKPQTRAARISDIVAKAALGEPARR
jgi:uncharacterized protein YdeI (YjbR/CyaY-like superfamily)